ncbi:MAG: hypothetical protein EXR72_22725 [Myxococcales bacterium]|nr:hypothetical protein [Myxococcales bacterium]
MAESTAASLVPGQRIGKYVVTEKLGEGGMGVVFGGVHEALRREVAIKLLRSEFSSNANVVARFHQEAEAVSAIGHLNIVAVYDFGQLDDGSLYYVMERIRGQTLTERIETAPPPGRDETLAIFDQICRALQAAHGHNIVHRDLKPDNVLLAPKAGGFPHVKVLDFGIAKMRRPLGGGGTRLTAVGTLLGTPAYMAPEQIDSARTVDGRADLYSLGAMLYETLTGRPPFGLGPPLVVISKQLTEKPAPPSSVAGWRIPPALDAVVLKSLQKDPAARQADPAVFLAELEAAWTDGSIAPVYGLAVTAVDGSAATVDVVTAATPVPAARAVPASAPPAVAPAPVAVPPAPVARRSLWPLVIGGAGLLIAGAVGVLVLGPSAPTAPVGDPGRREAREVIEAALHGDAELRIAAVAAIGEVGGRASLAAISAALADPNPEVRRAAAQAATSTGVIGDPVLHAALLAAAPKSGGAAAVEVAAARLRDGDLAVEAELRGFAEQGDPGLRLRAAVALAQGDRLDAAKLRATLQAAPPAVRRALRREAWVQLVRLGDLAAVGELKAALAGKDPIARYDAASTLARTGDVEARRLLPTVAREAADPADRVEAAALHAELGGAPSLSALRASLAAPEGSARSRAATALGRLAARLPDPSAVAAQLKTLLKDPDAPVRLAAAAALLALPEPIAAPGP